VINYSNTVHRHRLSPTSSTVNNRALLYTWLAVETEITAAEPKHCFNPFRLTRKIFRRFCNKFCWNSARSRRIFKQTSREWTCRSEHACIHHAKQRVNMSTSTKMSIRQQQDVRIIHTRQRCLPTRILPLFLPHTRVDYSPLLSVFGWQFSKFGFMMKFWRFSG